MIRSDSNSDASTDSPSTTLSPSMPSIGIGSRGQMGSNLVGLFIGVLIAGIVAIQVFIPVINDAISSSSVSGTAATVLGLLPLFAALLVLIALAAPLMRRV